MMRKTGKLFLIFGMIICILFSCLFFSGSTAGSIIHVDFFYKKSGTKLKNNKVTVAIGNSVFDEEQNKVVGVDSDYYQGIVNIRISVYIDNEDKPVDVIEIDNEALFGKDYFVRNYSSCRKLTKSDYTTTYTYDISDYNINDYIKFVVSYDWNYKQNKNSRMKVLYLYGKFENGVFIINKEKR
ncbi:MAG: hypothetical protein IKC33_05915 [Clostridia bacterium]|nr:hypothetical protein [Clostridia bacterium]